MPGCGSNNSRQVIPSSRWFHSTGSSQQLPNRHSDNPCSILRRRLSRAPPGQCTTQPWLALPLTVFRMEFKRVTLPARNNNNQLLTVMSAGLLASTSLICCVFRPRKVVWCQIHWIWVSVPSNKDELLCGVSNIDWNCNVSAILSILNKISECHKSLLSYFLRTLILNWLLHYVVLIHAYILMSYQWFGARL